MITWRARDGWPRRVRVEEPAHVRSARELAADGARVAGYPPADVHDVALAATELAENLHRHAVHGELVVGLGESSDCAQRPDVLLTALDRGPGVARFDECLVDGYTTSGTLGTGLGSVRRRAQHFDAFSEEGVGTAVVATFTPRDRRRQACFDIGRMGFPLEAGMPNGDSYAAAVRDTRLAVMLADGLGHGPAAALASASATAQFLALDGPPGPDEALARVSSGVVSGRGSAASIATARVADFLDGGVVTTAGLGNVSIVVAAPDGVLRRIPVGQGTVGVSPRSRNTQRATDLPGGATLVLHSDGLTSRWTLDGRAGLLRHDAATIAAVLWRDHARTTDDTMVVVVKAVPWLRS